jgi:hypothetical protein
MTTQSTRRKRPRPSQLSTTSLHPSISIGPASTPQINHHPPLFHPDHLFPLLRPDDDASLRARRRRSGGSEVEGWEWDEAASEAGAGAAEGGEVVNRGMMLWGSALVVGATTSFVLGFWSIAVGPFVDTEGVMVRVFLSRMSRLAGE